MTNVIRPLLACTIDDLTLLRLPVLVSAKLDGIRCVITDGVAMSRNGKVIRNTYVQQTIGKYQYNGLDGELIVGPPSGDGVFNRTMSGITAADGIPDFTFWVFDNHTFEYQTYQQRYASTYAYPQHARIQLLPQTTVTSLTELADFEKRTLDAGFEGVMIRRPDGPYKQGRSTLNEQILLRLKRFRDGEATVKALEEGKVNNNELTRNALGYAERSTQQANMGKAGLVGTLICIDEKNGEEMRISPGRMSHDVRRYQWLTHQCIGKKIKYKCFDYGAIDAPRFATFQAFLD